MPGPDPMENTGRPHGAMGEEEPKFLSHSWESLAETCTPSETEHLRNFPVGL